jgi:hypothetical protein
MANTTVAKMCNHPDLLAKNFHPNRPMPKPGGLHGIAVGICVEKTDRDKFLFHLQLQTSYSVKK